MINEALGNSAVAKPGVTRRTFLASAAGAAGAMTVGGSAALAAGGSASGLSRVQHVVVVMMENRSFDHFLGWLPGGNGRQAGLTYRDRVGVAHATHPLAPDEQGCAHPDPDHSYEGARVEFNNGACDGWLRASTNDEYSIGYYRRSDLAFLGKAVPQWTTFSRYFAAIMAETYPNRIYQHAGQTDRIHNSTTISTLPTIWDRLAAANVSGRYYFSDVPFLAVWGSKYIPISRPVSQFYLDCAAGTLPNVSYIDPRFEDEGSGTSGDDHPHADIRNGEAFMAGLYRAVTTGPNWPHTVLIFNFDEWGGFYDHVPPPTAAIPASDKAAGNQDGRVGFRVPCVVVSPFARRGYIASRTYDHTSILRMIEQRWSLAPLSVRDRNANSLAEVLNFSSPNLQAPQYNVPTGPFGTPCGTPSVGENWSALLAQARATGWPV